MHMPFMPLIPKLMARKYGTCTYWTAATAPGMSASVRSVTRIGIVMIVYLW